MANKLKSKGYDALCAAVDGCIDICIEGVKICDSNHLDLEAGKMRCEAIETTDNKGVLSIYSYGYYAVISTVASHIDLLEKFIDQTIDSYTAKKLAHDREILKKLAAIVDILKGRGYDALYTISDTAAEIHIEGTKICDSRGLNEGYTDDILVQLDDHKGFISLKNCGDFTVISSTADAIDLLEKYAKSII